jgi:hypothetical protein
VQTKLQAASARPRVGVVTLSDLETVRSATCWHCQSKPA